MSGYCSQCDALYEEGAKYCSTCGSQLSMPAADESPGRPPGAGGQFAAELHQAERFYSKLRTRVADWLEDRALDAKIKEYLLLLPDLLALLIRALRDPRIDLARKLELVPALLYVISPIDLIPDFLGPIGFVDDVVVMALVLLNLIRFTGSQGADILREHWEGPADVLERIQWLAAKADTVLASGVLAQLRRLFRRKDLHSPVTEG